MCGICGERPVSASSRFGTCGRRCGVALRERSRTPLWSRPKREYPPELVESVRRMYVDEWMSQQEIAETLGRSLKVIQRIMANHGIPRRRPIKRDQRGSMNSTWRGDLVGYGGAHRRVQYVRGKASAHSCVDCAERASEWSYAGACPREVADDRGRRFSPDPYRYEPRCVPCHRAHDASRRLEGGGAR